MWLVYIIVSNFCWSISDVSNSVLVNHYEKSAVAVAWFQSVIDLCILAVLLVLFPLEARWMPWFFLGGFLSYCAFLGLLYTIKHIDVSVMNAAWVFMSTAMAIGGFILFSESWTLLQSLGVVLAFFGVLLLSFWHQHVSLVHTVLLLAAVGLLYSPFFLIQKSALLSGVPVFTAFIWPVAFQKISAFVYGLCHPVHRSTIVHMKSIATPSFYIVTCIAVISSLLGWLLMTLAYNIAAVSLVAILVNMQPFTTMLTAWVATLFLGKFAPKELLTSQSVTIKLIAFTCTFIGLGMLVY